MSWCSLGWPGTWYLTQPGLKLVVLLSHSWMLDYGHISSCLPTNLQFYKCKIIKHRQFPVFQYLKTVMCWETNTSVRIRNLWSILWTVCYWVPVFLAESVPTWHMNELLSVDNTECLSVDNTECIQCIWKTIVLVVLNSELFWIANQTVFENLHTYILLPGRTITVFVLSYHMFMCSSKSCLSKEIAC